ncbi:MAG: Lsr2 family protein [Actinomycetaceae bacterium]|nr:Lsr2 family protein [Actinomycetaceae bacterium]
MAKIQKIILIDDVDRSNASETVSFAIDGVNYEIDLSDKNAKKLRDTLAPWAEKARRVAGRRRRGTGQAATTASREETQRIRKWAQDNGYKVSDRGRVSAKIREAYAAAH